MSVFIALFIYFCILFIVFALSSCPSLYKINGALTKLHYKKLILCELKLACDQGLEQVIYKSGMQVEMQCRFCKGINSQLLISEIQLSASTVLQ